MYLEEQLSGIGLTKGEVRVYLALVELGTSTVGPIIDKSGVSSSKVYVILEKLIHKGLASKSFKNKTNLFHPQDPSRLLDYLDNQQQALQERSKSIATVLPMLLASLSVHRETVVEMLHGKRGFMSVYEKELSKMKKGSTYYTIADYPFGKEYAGFWIRYHDIRADKKVHARMVYSHKNWYQPERLALRKKRKYVSVRVLPERVPIPSQVSLFDETVILSFFEGECISIVIRSHSFFVSMKGYFDMLWEKGTAPKEEVC